jgi:RNase P subunit RPR2
MANPKETQQHKRPLWTCPQCGHKFVTANIWHSCSRYPLSYHFKDKDPIVRELFDEYLALVESFGPVTVIPQKTRISFQVRVRFAAVMTRKHCLNCTIWLKRRADHPLIYKVEKLQERDHVHSLRLSSPAQLKDKALQTLLREAYDVGCQIY